jgi:hypothetical protein
LPFLDLVSLLLQLNLLLVDLIEFSFGSFRQILPAAVVFAKLRTNLDVSNVVAA